MTIMKHPLLLTLILTFFAVSAQPGHAEFDALLKKYVDEEGWVDYAGLKESKGELQAYIDMLEVDAPSDSWNDAQRKAYWLNAYNAYTLKLIIENYPLKSITDLEQPWDQQVAAINDQRYTLNDIEHKILREEFDDPRIHAGINCASISCPRLAREAFTAENVDSLLSDLMKEFVNDPERNQIAEKKIGISYIFQWFQEDFTANGDVIRYLNQYSDVKISPKARVDYIEYNWNLNGD